MSGSETRPPASGTGGEVADAAAGIPVSYWWWLCGITVSLLGSQVQAFGLGWAATAHGAPIAGLVITAGNVPGLVLMLIGGAVADSRGPWLVMVVSDGLMCGITAALAVTVACLGTPVWLLLSAAVLTGVSSAFYIPSSGRIPRRLVPGAALGKAMAARTMAGQLVSTLGSPVAGVGTCGLSVAGSLPLMLVVSGVMGAGLGLFGTHVAPVVLGGTPAAYLSRVQAVLTLCQTVPLIVGLNAGGLLVSDAGVRGALLTMGGVVCAVGVLAVLSRSVRHAPTGAPEGARAA
jgi:MFS family permease